MQLLLTAAGPPPDALDKERAPSDVCERQQGLEVRGQGPEVHGHLLPNRLRDPHELDRCLTIPTKLFGNERLLRRTALERSCNCNSKMETRQPSQSEATNIIIRGSTAV